MKNSNSPLGIEPATFRSVAHCLNQLRYLKFSTVVEIQLKYIVKLFCSSYSCFVQTLRFSLSSNEVISGIRYPVSCVHAMNKYWLTRIQGARAPWTWRRTEAEAYRSNNQQIKTLCNKLQLNIIYLIQMHGKIYNNRFHILIVSRNFQRLFIKQNMTMICWYGSM